MGRDPGTQSEAGAAERFAKGANDGLTSTQTIQVTGIFAAIATTVGALTGWALYIIIMNNVTTLAERTAVDTARETAKTTVQEITEQTAREVSADTARPIAKAVSEEIARVQATSVAENVSEEIATSVATDIAARNSSGVASRVASDVARQTVSANLSQLVEELLPETVDSLYSDMLNDIAMLKLFTGHIGKEGLSRYIGNLVMNANGDSLAEVIDFSRNDQTGVGYAVLSAGGFLGIGSKEVVLPLRDFVAAINNDEIILHGMTEDNLRNLEKYDEMVYTSLQ